MGKGPESWARKGLWRGGSSGGGVKEPRANRPAGMGDTLGVFETCLQRQEETTEALDTVLRAKLRPVSRHFPKYGMIQNTNLAGTQ